MMTHKHEFLDASFAKGKIQDTKSGFPSPVWLSFPYSCRTEAKQDILQV